MTAWTAHDLEILRLLLAGGKSYREIAEAVGRSVNAIHHQLERQGRFGRSRARPKWSTERLARLLAMFEAGESWEAMCGAFSRSKVALWGQLKKMRVTPRVTGRKCGPQKPPWSAEDDETLLRLFTEGMAWVEIARQLDRGAEACRSRRYVLLAERGVSPPPAPVAAWRKCLGPYCRGMQTFWSHHVGHRYCDRCRNGLNLVYDGRV